LAHAVLTICYFLNSNKCPVDAGKVPIFLNNDWGSPGIAPFRSRPSRRQAGQWQEEAAGQPWGFDHAGLISREAIVALGGGELARQIDCEQFATKYWHIALVDAHFVAIETGATLGRERGNSRLTLNPLLLAAQGHLLEDVPVHRRVLRAAAQASDALQLNRCEIEW
jgi:hypothetical protein